MNKKRGKTFLKGLLLGTLALSMMFTGGCGKKEEKTKIAVITMGHEAEFWQMLKKGAEDASNEVDIEMIFDSPDVETDFARQVQIINEAVNNNVDAIVISPCSYDDPDITQALDKAKNNGIKIVTVNSDSASDGVLANLSTDNEAAGGIAAREAMKYYPGDNKKIAVLGFNEGNEVCAARVDNFLDNIQGDMGDNIIPTRYTENSVDTAKEVTKTLINEYPDLAVVYASNEGCTVGACQAVEELGMKDSVTVIGFDSSETEVKYVNDGILKGFVAQSPYNMGYLGVRYALKAINGESLPYYIDTGATLVTPENVNDQITQLIIHPEKF